MEKKDFTPKEIVEIRKECISKIIAYRNKQPKKNQSPHSMVVEEELRPISAIIEEARELEKYIIFS